MAAKMRSFKLQLLSSMPSILDGKCTVYSSLAEVYPLRIVDFIIFVRQHDCWGLLEQLQVLASP